MKNTDNFFKFEKMLWHKHSVSTVDTENSFEIKNQVD